MNKLILIAVTGATLGCVKQAVTAPQAVAALENVWTFSVELSVETESTGLGDAAEVELKRLGAVDSSIEGTVMEGPLRINSDGTESWRLRFHSVSNGEGVPHPLQGHAVETRRFGGGPLLSLQQTEYAAALGHFSALDPFAALLFLTPPSKNDTRSQFAWPFRLDSGRKSHHFSNLIWERVQGEGSTVFLYKGQLSAKAQDRTWQAKAQGKGQLSGEIEVGKNGKILVHRFRVDRNFDWHFQGQKVDVLQHHVLQGEFRPLPGQKVEPWGQDFYLTEAQVLAGIQSQASVWEACAPASDWSRPLKFQIDSSGHVAPLEGLGPCAQVLSEGVFFPHHHSDFQVQSQVVIQGGNYIPYPTATIPSADTMPAHLVFQLGTDIAELRVLLDSEGVTSDTLP